MMQNAESKELANLASCYLMMVERYKTFLKETNYFGATLRALYNLGRKLGYSLVCCNNTGTHAFFIRDDCVPDNLYGVNNYRLLYRSLKTNPKSESGYYEHEDGQWTSSEVLLKNPH